MTPIRRKYYDKLGRSFGSNPPSWATGGGLGTADSNPDFICRGLGLGGFNGSGEDWVQDIANALRLAVRSRVLYGMYSEPIIAYDRKRIKLNARSDVAGFGGGAVAMRMLKSTLWAAEQQGRLAMPSALKFRISGALIEIYV